ncbi:MAG: HU family DNA-binding protein [Elusimicrobiota bacterium]
MNKTDIVNKVSQVTCADIEAKESVEKFLDTIKSALQREERVTISNFGSFYVEFRKARKGINPQTGEKIDIPPKKVVKFKPSPKLDEKV